MIETVIDKVAMRLAWWMPKRLVGWVAIRVWAHATQGKWSDQDATAVTAHEAIERWGDQ